MIFFFTLQRLLSTIKMFLVFIKPVAEKQYFKPRAQVYKDSSGAVYCCWFSASQVIIRPRADSYLSVIQRVSHLLQNAFNFWRLLKLLLTQNYCHALGKCSFYGKE